MSANALAWPCHGCGQWRDDKWISVAHRTVPYGLSDLPMLLRLRYCNDRVACLHKVADKLEEWAHGLTGVNEIPEALR